MTKTNTVIDTNKSNEKNTTTTKTPSVKKAVSKTSIDKAMPKPVSNDSSSESSVLSNVSNEVIPVSVINRLNTIREDFRVVSERFVRIGYNLYNFQHDKTYKLLGFKRFDDFVLCEFALSKATAYSFINVACKFTVLDKDGHPTLTIKKEFKDFSSSQLVAMLSLDDNTLKEVKPTDSVRDIKKLKNKAESSTDSDCDESDNTADTKDSEESGSKSKPSKVGKDATVPVNRLFMGMIDNVDELDRFKPILSKYISKRKTDKVNYRIEINIVWEQDESLASLEGVV